MTNEESNKEELVTKSKYLEIRIKEKRYCVPLKDISEVVPQFDISSVPLAPDYFKGLINLRGQILSVIDLSKKLENTKTEVVLKKTCIVIFNIEALKIGALVDEVIAVRSISSEFIDTHSYVNEKKDNFISGVIKYKENENEEAELLFILDLVKLLDINEIKKLVEQKAS